MPSPKRSPKTALWTRLETRKAERVLVDCYGDGAGAEVLLRAFLAEREGKADSVRFWLAVYDGLTGEKAEDGVSPAASPPFPPARSRSR